MYFNKKTLQDRIYACWLGKNLGGTLGGPYEAKREINDIKGFATEPGAPLPNDDLDLQLIWLRALMEQGPDRLNANILGQYWINFIVPYWNEYGIGKTNMEAGLLPPLSGQAYNEEWRNSNGAWIRTEIWACLCPGRPEEAIRFAYEDACVDHGISEGTYAAIFVAAMQSAAFVIQDIHTLIEIGLSKIPADCRMARSIRLVVEEHQKGTDWKTVRNMLVEQSADIGWFQAPANVGFVVLGLLYGEGDFKKSLILAVNCGDDTDCTAGTVGALLGIMGGTAAVPEDWRAYIGDAIITMSVNWTAGHVAHSCTELTELVMEMIPVVAHPKTLEEFLATGSRIHWGDEADDFADVSPETFMGDAFVQSLASRSPYSFEVDGAFYKALVEFNGNPQLDENGSIKLRVTVSTKSYNHKQGHYELHWHLPEGWQVSGRRNVVAPWIESTFVQDATAEVVVTAGEKVEPTNRLVLEIRRSGYADPPLVPITILA